MSFDPNWDSLNINKFQTAFNHFVFFAKIRRGCFSARSIARRCGRLLSDLAPDARAGCLAPGDRGRVGRFGYDGPADRGVRL